MVNTYHYYGGGDSTYTFALAELLRSKGHAVFFFAMQDPGNVPDPNADLFVSHLDYREMNRRRSPIAASRVLGHAIYSIEARQKFARLLDRVQPDIVHLQSIHAHITPSVILEAKRRRIPVVWTLHDYKLICPNSHFLIDQTGEICEACRVGRFWQATVKRCKKGSLPASATATLEAYVHQLIGVRGMVAAFLCPSAFLLSKFLENGFDPQTLHRLPHFLPPAAFTHTAPDEGYLLFFGRLEPMKGVFQLLEACRKAPQIHVRLAGRIGQIDTVMIQSQLSGNADYVGVRTGDDLWALVGRSRAAVVPSIWYENQPFSILEAFANGKPVIASSIGGMQELVKDHETGLLVEPGNVDQLARAMVWMSERPDAARRMGEAARAYAQDVHSAEKHYESLISIYQSVLRDHQKDAS